MAPVQLPVGYNKPICSHSCKHAYNGKTTGRERGRELIALPCSLQNPTRCNSSATIKQQQRKPVAERTIAEHAGLQPGPERCKRCFQNPEPRSASVQTTADVRTRRIG